MSTPMEHTEQMEQILDGAKLVKVDLPLRQLAVWHGGVTINTYGVGTLNPITCFSLSDDKGRPRERAAVEQHIEEFFERERDHRDL